jgi:hypothetical protein
VAAFGRIEQLRDRRDTTDVAQINQTLTEELAAKAFRTSASVTPTDTQAFRFLTDYWLGDRVTSVLDGIPLIEVVRELSLTVTPSGERVVPVIGTPGTTAPGLTFGARLKEQRARVSHLERR